MIVYGILSHYNNGQSVHFRARVNECKNDKDAYTFNDNISFEFLQGTEYYRSFIKLLNRRSWVYQAKMIEILYNESIFKFKRKATSQALLELYDWTPNQYHKYEHLTREPFNCTMVQESYFKNDMSEEEKYKILQKLHDDNISAAELALEVTTNF